MSLREGTFFEKSKLTVRQWVVLMYWWVRQYPVGDAAQEAEVQEKSAIQSYQYMRDICSWRLLNRDAPLMLGGQGVVVQIDESLFRHKPKVSCSSTTIKLEECLTLMASGSKPTGIWPRSSSCKACRSTFAIRPVELPIARKLLRACV